MVELLLLPPLTGAPVTLPVGDVSFVGLFPLVRAGAPCTRARSTWVRPLAGDDEEDDSEEEVWW